MSEVQNQPSEFLNVEDWATRLRLSRRQVFRWIADRTIPPADVSIGRTRRWHRSTYKAWVKSHKGRS